MKQKPKRRKPQHTTATLKRRYIRTTIGNYIRRPYSTRKKQYLPCSKFYDQNKIS